MEKKERVRLYGLELKSPLVLKLAVKEIMVCSGYKDNSGVVKAETCVLMVIKLK
jgi:hypothetical protein